MLKDELNLLEEHQPLLYGMVEKNWLELLVIVLKTTFTVPLQSYFLETTSRNNSNRDGTHRTAKKRN